MFYLARTHTHKHEDEELSSKMCTEVFCNIILKENCEIVSKTLITFIENKLCEQVHSHFLNILLFK